MSLCVSKVYGSTAPKAADCPRKAAHRGTQCQFCLCQSPGQPCRLLPPRNESRGVYLQLLPSNLDWVQLVIQCYVLIMQSSSPSLVLHSLPSQSSFCLGLFLGPSRLLPLVAYGSLFSNVEVSLNVDFLIGKMKCDNSGLDTQYRKKAMNDVQSQEKSFWMSWLSLHDRLCIVTLNECYYSAWLMHAVV